MNMEAQINDLIIAAVPATMIELVWTKVEPHIQRVIDKAPDDLLMSKIKDRLISGSTLLVTISRDTEVIAINVLDVKVLDTGKRVLYIPITGGDELDSWMADFLKIAAAIAKDYNCTELRGMAVRKGWMRKLKQFGWEESFTTIRCEIGE